MMIKQLSIENFRNIENERFEPSPGLNLIYGDNASGKTSTLEAISVLSSLRSFRSAKLSELVRYQQSGFRVYGLLADGSGQELPIGVARQEKELTLRAGGQKLKKVSELATKLPVQIIHPDSHQIVSGGPKQRRRFVDWGVFHVEHEYHQLWRKYEKALSQRNAALRLNQIGKDENAWDIVLSEVAEKVHLYRERYISDLQALLPEYTREISRTSKVELEYYPGWDTNKGLMRALADTWDRDKKRGFTSSGPHRAELNFKVDGKPADKHVSRGQQKMLVFAMLLSQVVLFRAKKQKNCVLLLDDLAAELDQAHRNRLLALLQDISVQLFITCIKRESIQVDLWQQHKVFHVERGKIHEVV